MLWIRLQRACSLAHVPRWTHLQSNSPVINKNSRLKIFICNLQSQNWEPRWNCEKVKNELQSTSSRCRKMTTTANFTGHEKQTTLSNPLEPYCSPELAEGIQLPLVCLIVLNIFLSICAFLGNSLILVALHKKSSLHTPSKLLLRCLSASDLCVGLIAEPAIVVYWTSLLFGANATCRYSALVSHLTGYILGSVSLLTLTAISIDRRLALTLGLKYRQIVTLKRTCMTVIAVWLLSIVGTTLFFVNYFITLWYGTIIILSCLVTSIYAYTMIFRFLHCHAYKLQKTAYQGQPSQNLQPLNLAQYKKSVKTALCVQLTLVVCYLPYAVAQALPKSPHELSQSLYLGRAMALTLVDLNSTLNPILYYWRIGEVRRSVKESLRRLACSS